MCRGLRSGLCIHRLQIYGLYILGLRLNSRLRSGLRSGICGLCNGFFGLYHEGIVVVIRGDLGIGLLAHCRAEYRAPYRCYHELDNCDRKQSIHQQAGPYAFLVDDEDHYDCKYECNCFKGISYYVCYKRSFFRGRAYGSHIECKVHEREQYGACHCNDGYRRLDVVRAEEEGSRVESAGEQHGECADAVGLAEERYE